ncbi:hypothetical protein FOZ62_030233, partial [Perkinsus olseni]
MAHHSEGSHQANAAAAKAALAAASFLWGVATKTMNNSVKKSDLKVGDHIYQWRKGSLYSHHGIVVDVNPCPSESCDHRGVCCTR